MLNLFFELLNGGVSQVLATVLVNAINIYLFKQLNKTKNKLTRKVRKLVKKVLYFSLPLGIILILVAVF